MFQKLNEIVKSKISDEKVIEDVMLVVDQYELTHSEDFIIKCFAIAYLFYNKIVWTLDNYNLTDHKGLWYLGFSYEEYDYHDNRMTMSHKHVILNGGNISLCKMLSYIMNTVRTDTNTNYDLYPCIEVYKKYIGKSYQGYTDVGIHYKFILKEENYTNIPQANQKENKSLSVGDGIAATACIAGMGGLLAAPLMFL